MNDSEFVTALDEIPGSAGWWRADGREEFGRLAALLTGRGLSRELTVEVLDRAYGAVAGEFGS